MAFGVAYRRQAGVVAGGMLVQDGDLAAAEVEHAVLVRVAAVRVGPAADARVGNVADRGVWGHGGSPYQAAEFSSNLDDAL